MRPKLGFILFAWVLLCGCGPKSPFLKGDILVSQSNGRELGKVLQVARHTFPTGLTADALLIESPDKEQQWLALDTVAKDYKTKE